MTVNPTPQDFFLQRRSWLEEKGAVTVAQNENGQWSVYLRIDGYYSTEKDARHVAKGLSGFVRSALAHAIRSARRS